MLSALNRYFASANFSARLHREDNDEELREKLEQQYELMKSTDPEVRKSALTEIDRLRCLFCSY